LLCVSRDVQKSLQASLDELACAIKADIDNVRATMAHDDVLQQVRVCADALVWTVLMLLIAAD
jgi:hypothetical protein